MFAFTTWCSFFLEGCEEFGCGVMVEEASSGTLFLAAAAAAGGVVKRGGSASGCEVPASDLSGSGAFFVLFPVIVLSTFSSKIEDVVVPAIDEASKAPNSALGPGSLSDVLLLRDLRLTRSSDAHLDEEDLRANLPEDDRFVRLRVRCRAGIDAEAIIGGEEARRFWSSLLHLRVRVGEFFFMLAFSASTALGLFIICMVCSLGNYDLMLA